MHISTTPRPSPSMGFERSQVKVCQFFYVPEFGVNGGIVLLRWDKLALLEIFLIFAILVTCFPACKSSLILSCSSMFPIILLPPLFRGVGAKVV